jgi:hypothetical protein
MNKRKALKITALAFLSSIVLSDASKRVDSLVQPHEITIDYNDIKEPMRQNLDNGGYIVFVPSGYLFNGETWYKDMEREPNEPESVCKVYMVEPAIKVISKDGLVQYFAPNGFILHGDKCYRDITTLYNYEEYIKTKKMIRS